MSNETQHPEILALLGFTSFHSTYSQATRIINRSFLVMNHKLFYYGFEIKYYQWRLKEAQKEYKTSFERLSGMKSYCAREILEVISNFSQEEQSKIYRITPYD